MRSAHLTLRAVNHVSYELLNNNILLATVAVRLTNAYLRFTVDGDAKCSTIYPYEVYCWCNMLMD